MEEQEECTSTSILTQSLKRKQSETESSTDSNSRSPNTPTYTSSSSCEVNSSPCVIPACTSEWTKDTLHKLNIDVVTTEQYSAKDLVNIAFQNTKHTIEKSVQLCKERILKSSSPLKQIDVDDVDTIDSSSAFSLMYKGSRGTDRYKCLDAWNISSFDAKHQTKMEDQICSKFRIYGERFSDKLIHMAFLREKKYRITEYWYQNLFEEFVGMFGLSCLGNPLITPCNLKIGSTEIVSVPDVIFPILGKSDDDIKVMTVCEVKANFDTSDRLSPRRTRKVKKPKFQEINHLDDKLIGQFGGELLAHCHLTQNHSGLLGIIVQKTNVTFSHLQCNHIQLQQIKDGHAHLSIKPHLYFSRPYNYMKASDRLELIEPLLKLGIIQCSP